MTYVDEKGYAVPFAGYRNDTASTGERVLASVALRIAADVMSGAPHQWTPNDISLALAYINDIRAQHGCEHLDPAVTDGYLTHFIDIVVVG